MSHADLITEQQRYYHDLLSSDDDPGRLSEEPRRLHSAGVQQRRKLEDCVAGHSHVYLGSIKVKEELGTSGLFVIFLGPAAADAGGSGDEPVLCRSLLCASRTHCLFDSACPTALLLEQSSTLVTSLESVQIPSLSSRLKEFRRRTAEEALTLSSLSSLLKNQDQLLEILEIPSLMETCVRSEQYDAALELRGFVDKMRVLHGGRGGEEEGLDDLRDENGRRHGQRVDNRTLGMIEADVRRVVASMTEQLLGQLEREVSLTACLQIVGTLKRVVGREAEVGFELRRAFLERRGRWVDACVGDVRSDTPVEYIRGLTDVYRLQVADVMLQYRTIFFGARGGGGASGAVDGAPRNLPVNDPSFSWATTRMAYYLEQVEETLPQISDGSSLASVLESCSYAGRALARVGCDPRGALLFGMVKDSAVRVFDDLLEVAEETFVEMVGVHRWVAIPVGKGGQGGEEHASVTPPMALVEHTPLAVYTNGVLAALNELRHCCPVEVRQRVEARLSQSIQLVERALDEVERPRGIEEEQVYAMARRAMREVMVPFLRDSLQRLFSM